jgi:hypothetical protein
MQATLGHLNDIVRPAFRNDLSAETALNTAHESKDPDAIELVGKAVMRVARIAALLISLTEMRPSWTASVALAISTSLRAERRDHLRPSKPECACAMTTPRLKKARPRHCEISGG